MNGSQRAVQCRVAGRVQGVCYRAATRERALELGLGGWARNLPDGQVEVVLAGDEEAIGALTAWLWEGPPAARVTRVSVAEWSAAVPPGFSTR